MDERKINLELYITLHAQLYYCNIIHILSCAVQVYTSENSICLAGAYQLSRCRQKRNDGTYTSHLFCTWKNGECCIVVVSVCDSVIQHSLV